MELQKIELEGQKFSVFSEDQNSYYVRREGITKGRFRQISKSIFANVEVARARFNIKTTQKENSKMEETKTVEKNKEEISGKLNPEPTSISQILEAVVKETRPRVRVAILKEYINIRHARLVLMASKKSATPCGLGSKRWEAFIGKTKANPGFIKSVMESKDWEKYQKSTTLEDFYSKIISRGKRFELSNLEKVELFNIFAATMIDAFDVNTIIKGLGKEFPLGLSDKDIDAVLNA